MMTRPQNDCTRYYPNDNNSSQQTRVLPPKWAWKEERKSYIPPSSQYDNYAYNYEYRDPRSLYRSISRRPSSDSYYDPSTSHQIQPSASQCSTIASSSSSLNSQPTDSQFVESDHDGMGSGPAIVEPEESSDPVSNTKQPLRRSTRQPGLVKNPYIAREAQALKVARNRVYALIDASDEASRLAALSKAQKLSSALGDSLLLKEQSPSRLALKKAGNGGTSSAKKRKRGEAGLDAESERYELAYGYGEKDGEGIELEKELEKEQREFETRLWVEGPASTGAVVAYMRAKKRLLEVVGLVAQWEEIKARRLANGEDVGEINAVVEPVSTTEVERPPPPTIKQIRRTARNRNTATPSGDGTPSARPSPRLTRSRLQNERQQSNGPATTENTSSQRQAQSVSPTKTAVPPNSETLSMPSARSRRSVSASTEGSQINTESKPPASPSQDGTTVITLRKGRVTRQTKKVEESESNDASVPEPHPPEGGNEDSATEGRTLRSRSKIALPSRFGDYVANHP
ncbi:hypothetical protein FRC02_005009 [Tulasnella sp. 418]|nr:hypothetical protein FRC02_005009 [Tulasnella sp. 418]